jgi:hypothetical protein
METTRVIVPEEVLEAPLSDIRTLPLVMRVTLITLDKRVSPRVSSRNSRSYLIPTAGGAGGKGGQGGDGGGLSIGGSSQQHRRPPVASESDERLSSRAELLTSLFSALPTHLWIFCDLCPRLWNQTTHLDNDP